ncbi:hypothetical protein WN943_006812 [Citrus x changshan-huyou]
MDIDSSLLPATTTVRSSSSSGGCTDILGRSNTPSFSYFKDWKFNYGADLKAKYVLQQALLLALNRPYAGSQGGKGYIQNKRTRGTISQKKNYDHLPKDVYFERSKLATPITLQALNPVVSTAVNLDQQILSMRPTEILQYYRRMQLHEHTTHCRLWCVSLSVCKIAVPIWEIFNSFPFPTISFGFTIVPRPDAQVVEVIGDMLCLCYTYSSWRHVPSRFLDYWSSRLAVSFSFSVSVAAFAQ